MKVYYKYLPVKDCSLKIQSHSENDPLYTEVTVVIHDITKEAKKVCSECLVKHKLREIYGNDIEIEEIKNGNGQFHG